MITTLKRPMPINGLVKHVPADAIDNQQSPNLRNVRFRFDAITPVPGRAPLAGPVAYPVLEIARFSVDDDTKWLVMLTDQAVYKWGDTVPGSPAAWLQVPGVAIHGEGRWSWTSGEDYLFFARKGGNGIYRWAGGNSSIEMVPNAPDDVRFVCYFNNRLVAANLEEQGESWANRLRWPVNGNHNDWTGNGSGFMDLYEPEQEPIQGMIVLSNRLTVFREHSLTDLVATGTLTPVFTSEQRAANIGSVFPYTISSNGAIVIFLANDGNVWAWNGSSVQSIGDPIYRLIEQSIDLVAGGMTYSGKVYPYANEYWLWLGGNLMYVLDLLKGRWMIDDFPNFAAMGDTELHTYNRTWANAVGSWGSYAMATWRDQTDKATSRLIVAKSDNSTISIGRDISGNEDGSPVTSFVESKDYYLGENVGTIYERSDPMMQRTLETVLFIYEYSNEVDPVYVGVSTDKGVTWQEVAVMPNQSGFNLTSWKVTGNVIRYRFRTVSVLPGFRWFSFVESFVPGGPYLALEHDAG